MKQGRITQLVAETENMWIHTKINYEGGENEIHCHLDEDHSFIVLEGQMSVFDENGNEIKVEKHQGVMIPKGAYYRYHNTGKENLVVIRVGAGIKGQKPGRRRNARSPGRQAVTGLLGGEQNSGADRGHDDFLRTRPDSVETVLNRASYHRPLTVQWPVSFWEAV